MENSFGANLKRLRKNKGFTQEQLAGAVGVSPQAVSKWEMSSYPDASLLPAVADFLGVTVDELFGREREKAISMNQRVLNYCREAPLEEKIPLMFDLCRAAFMGSMGSETYAEISEGVLKATDWEQHSEITWEQGWLQARNNGNLQYFLLMPQPEKGYDDVLAYNTEMVRFFEFLGSPDALRALYFLAGRKTTTFFTAKAISNELGISKENAERIIEGLHSFSLVWQADISDGADKTEKAYQYLGGCNLVSFLTFARTLIKRPHAFSYQTGGRNSPYFINDTYKNPSCGQRKEK